MPFVYFTKIFNSKHTSRIVQSMQLTNTQLCVIWVLDSIIVNQMFP